MMNAAFRELGLDWRYVRLPVPPERFAETVRALPASGYAGANVTIPHKVAARDLADELTAAARAVGAANTLTFVDRAIEADNTDAAGLLDAVGGRLEGRRALVLGAGGAARAVVWALRQGGVEDVSIWNRTPARAATVAADLAARHVERPDVPEVLVNATSVGLEPIGEAGALRALGLEGAERPELLVDLVYGSAPTALAEWGRRGGARVVDGLEVLVRQGARSLERWTGLEAPLGAMRAALRQGADAR